MLQQSWKIIGVVLVLYAIVAGFTVPLKPGITTISPVSVLAGQNIRLYVETYNGHWDQINDASQGNAWLKIKPNYTLKAESLHVVNRNSLELNFSIPDNIPEKRSFAESILILDNEIDGPSVFPAALFIRQDSLINEFQSTNSWWLKNEELSLHLKSTFAFPFRNILVETIRNLFFHVSLWFSMFILFIVSVVYSILFLRNNQANKDHIASSFALVGVVYGLLGTATGAIWAKYTWGTYWTTDVKLNMTAILLLIYLAYFMLRSTISDIDRKRKLASAYNIFAFCMIIPLLFVIPRMTDSLHPGNGGNPGLGGEDLDHTLRMVFYPAVAGFTLIGVWMASMWSRLKNIEEQMLIRAFKKPDLNLSESEK